MADILSEAAGLCSVGGKDAKRELSDEGQVGDP